LGFVLNIATVPINEIDRSFLEIDKTDSFRHLVSRIMGIPKESILDEHQYQKLTEMLLEEKFWHNFYNKSQYNRCFYENFVRDVLQHERSYYRSDKDTLLLAKHALFLMSSPIRTEFPLTSLSFLYNNESRELLS
jgi:hypothetical protein